MSKVKGDYSIERNLTVGGTATVGYGSSVTNGTSTLTFSEYPATNTYASGIVLSMLDSDLSIVGVNNTLLLYAENTGDTPTLVMGSIDADNLLIQSYDPLANTLMLSGIDVSGYPSTLGMYLINAPVILADPLTGLYQDFSAGDIVANNTATISATVFTGSGLDDASSAGNYSGTDGATMVYTTKISQIGSVKTTSLNDGGINYSVNDSFTVLGTGSGCTGRVDTTDGAIGKILTTTIGGTGSGYSNGQIVTIDGGVGGQAQITGVGGGGHVINYTILTQGSGYSTGVATTTSGGMASGFTININTVALGIVLTYTIMNNGVGYSLGVMNTLCTPGTGLKIEITAIIDSISWIKGTYVYGYNVWSSDIPIYAGIPITLSDGVEITFVSDTGHTITDEWAITVSSTGGTGTFQGGVNIYTGTTYKINGIPVVKGDTGLQNYYFGGFAGNITGIGKYNTAAGYLCLNQNTTGEANLAMGYSALNSNTEGSYNVALGDQTLMLNLTGTDNTAVGYSALYFNDSGSSNYANGLYALYSNISGSDNVGIGKRALYNSTDSSNIAIGFEALANLYNGSNNIGIGNSTDVSTATLNSVVVIGNSLSVGADYALIVGGISNVVDGEGSAAISGVGNANHGYYSNIFSGSGNTITIAGTYSTILGGIGNTVSGGNVAMILGGGYNVASGLGATLISAGYSTASGEGAMIMDSTGCTAEGYGAYIVNSGNASITTGGAGSAIYSSIYTTVSNQLSVAVGASYSTISGTDSMTIGGMFNNVSGISSYALGLGISVTGDNSFGIGLEPFVLGIISSPVYTPVGTPGLDDAGAFGLYFGTDVITVIYTVEIVDGSSTPNTIKYKKDTGAWSSPVDIDSVNGNAVGDGVIIGFYYDVGHTTGDQWAITVTPQSPTVIPDSNVFQMNWGSDYVQFKDASVPVTFGTTTLVLTFPEINVNTQSFIGKPILITEGTFAIVNKDIGPSNYGINALSVANYDTIAQTINGVNFGVALDGSSNQYGYLDNNILIGDPSVGPPFDYYKLTSGALSVIVNQDVLKHQDVEPITIGTGTTTVVAAISHLYHDVLGDAGALFYANAILMTPTGYSDHYASLVFATQDLTNGASIQANWDDNCFYANWDWNPTDDNTYNLGNSTHKWKDLYLSGKINATGLPSGTLVSPPGGLNIGDLWQDVTTSAQYPIIRIRAT